MSTIFTASLRQKNSYHDENQCEKQLSACLSQIVSIVPDMGKQGDAGEEQKPRTVSKRGRAQAEIASFAIANMVTGTSTIRAISTSRGIFILRCTDFRAVHLRAFSI